MPSCFPGCGAQGSIRSIDDIKAIVVDTRDGIPIRVKDVARVQVGSMTRYGAVTIDGRGETVEGLVLGLRGANAGQLVRDVRQRLQEVADKGHPAAPIALRWTAALAAIVGGDRRAARENLRLCHAEAARLGGSHAQRSVVDRTIEWLEAPSN